MYNENNVVTVIVPIYNVGKYVEKCIRSILTQDYKNLDIVLVDDGSIDSSGKIADYFSEQDQRVTVIHQKNAGVSSARNAGLAVAKGKYVCFVDGDDYILKDYVSYLYDMINTNKVEIALTTDMFSSYDTAQIKQDNQRVVSGEQAAIEILSYNIPIGVYCKMFLTQFIRDNKVLFDETLCMGEGFSFNVNAFQKSKNVCIGQKRVYFYRKDNETSATTRFSIAKWENALYAIEKMHDNFVFESKGMETAWRFARWRAHSDAYNLLVMSGSEDKYLELKEKCLRQMRNDGKYAFLAPTPRRERIRALGVILIPSLFPKLLVLRRRRHNVRISN